MKRLLILALSLLTLAGVSAKNIVMKQVATVPFSAPDMPWVEAPNGTDVFYSLSTKGYINYQGHPVVEETDRPARIWYDGDDVYIQSPVPSARILSYIKGTGNEQGFTVTFPQFLGTVYDNHGNPHKYYVNVIDLIVTPRANDTYECWYQNAEGETTVSYIANNEGELTLQIPDSGLDPLTDLPKRMIGICYDLDAESDYSWSCYADWYECYESFSEEPISLPDGLETESWSLVADDFGRLMHVAFDGDDVYVANWTNDMQEAYVIGRLNDGIVTFPRTYLGTAEDYNSFVWMAPAEWETLVNPATGETAEDYVVTQEIDFYFDAEKRVFSPVKDTAAIFVIPAAKPGDLIPAYFEFFPTPEIRWQNPTTADAAPQNPKFIGLYDLQYYLGCDIVEFNLPCFNIHGNLLDTNDMYYVFYLDGEPFTFMPDEYMGISEDMTEIPYSFNDYNSEIYAYRTNHQISIFAIGYESLGVQQFFRGSDGTVYASQLVTATVEELENLTNGIERPIPEGTVTSTYYTTLTGLQVQNPGKGVYIKTIVYSDGTRRCLKEMRLDRF